jgi:DHA2 family multidrug resistance protein-like MFS transporter
MIALPMDTVGVGGLNFPAPYFLLADDGHAHAHRDRGNAAGWSVGMTVFSPIAGVLADRIGNRPVALAGTVVVRSA